MEIGNQIKALRIRKGATQKQMAQHFGITEQAISKWENNASVPDIAMLPDLSAYFGVSIDELFALSDETRMERIQTYEAAHLHRTFPPRSFCRPHHVGEAWTGIRRQLEYSARPGRLLYALR